MRSHIKIALDSIGYFQSDNKLDHFELKALFDLALKDGHIDAEEASVLRSILKRISDDEKDDDMLAQIEKVNQALAECEV